MRELRRLMRAFYGPSTHRHPDGPSFLALFTLSAHRPAWRRRQRADSDGGLHQQMVQLRRRSLYRVRTFPHGSKSPKIASE